MKFNGLKSSLFVTALVAVCAPHFGLAQEETSDAEVPTESPTAPAEASAEKTSTEGTETAAPPAEPVAAESEAVVASPAEPVADDSVAPAEKKSWTDVIAVKGDFRYRLDIENIADQPDTKVRHRHRIRARLGVLADLPQGFKAELRLATGSQDPVSTNQTLSDAFSTKPVWIDLAFGGWYPEFAKGLFVEAGKMHNPFLTIGKTELIFDGDLTPEGAAVGYSNTFGIAEPFINAAGFYVQERSTADDSWLLGIQGGVKLTIAEDIVHFILGVSYYDHTRIQGNASYYDIADAQGNSATPVDPTDPETAVLYDNDYNLVNGFFEVGGKAGRFPWAVFTDLVYNAAAPNNNFGWLIGASFGKCKNPLDFDVKYSYRQLQADAVVAAFSDSDFIGGGTDGQGHEWNIDFQAAKALKLGLTYFFNKSPVENGENYNRGQIDFILKF